MNKDRIREVRALSAEIGETAAGLSDLRTNGGGRYRLAQVSNRLGHLFEIRRRIYMKKFFMKFLNNLIGHLTPFFFYAIGGVLAIRGEITVGALVAALAAYKDLSSPWKELLTYYNQVQDMSLRWQVMTEKFTPAQMIKPELFEGEPKDIPHLRGDIELRDVVVKDSEGNPVLDGLTMTLPAGARIAIQCTSERERAAFAQLLTREILPSSGTVKIAEQSLDELHQGVIAARIGYAYSDPYLFDGSVGDNVLMPLRNRPRGDMAQGLMGRIEAVKAGNSPDTLDADWVSPELAGIADEDGLRDWWFQLVEAMGIDGQLFHRTLHTRLQESHRGLEKQIMALRPQIEAKLVEKGIRDAIFRFVPEYYNPTLTLAENLLFAFPVQPVPETLFTDPDGPFQRLLRAEKLDLEVRQISLNLLDMLERTFGRDGTNHPLFQRIGLDEGLYRRILAAAERLRSQRILKEEEKALLCTLPFLLTEEEFRPGLPEEFKKLIQRLRKSHGDLLLSQCKGVFRRLREDEYARKLTVLENALFGRVSAFAGARAEAVEDAVAEVLADHDLRSRLALMLYDLPTGLGGSLLEPVIRERAAFTRAAIKRPDVLILDRALASHDTDSRLRTRRKLQQLLPHTTMIYMEDHFAHPERYDVFIEIKKGRLDGVPALRRPVSEGDVADFDRKLAELRNVELFAKLDPRNRRLLAFSAQWFPVAAGEPVFLSGEPGDGVYLCLSGRAEIRWAGRDDVLDEVLPGRLMGELAVILNAPRQLDLIAREDSLFLRIGAEEYRAVIETDASVAVELLKTVSTHLLNATNALLPVQGAPEAPESDAERPSEPS